MNRGPQAYGFRVVPHFRLRFGRTHLDLPLGEFTIGRASECSLVIDDGLVSRQHACLHVDVFGVNVEDLGSRNGVLVNGVKITTITPLLPDGRLTIGSKELVLLDDVDRHRARRRTAKVRLCPDCGTGIAEEEVGCLACAAAAQRDGAGRPSGLVSVPAGPVNDEFEGTPRASAFALLAPLVAKSLALGQPERAEALVRDKLESLLASCRAGWDPTPDVVAQASALALMLAEGQQQPRWLDFVFTLNTEANRVMPSADVDRLHQIVRSARYRSTKNLRAYLERIRQKAELSASDRFSIRRLESLVGVIAA